jgi:hypothetical protein
MASQIFKRGCTIVANIRSAKQSKADFIHKFKISAKGDELYIG